MRPCLLTCLIVWSAWGAHRISVAHEGHRALPSTGVTREGNQLLISDAAIKAIAMQSATIKLGDLQQTLRVNARVELPWSGQAKVTTLTAGKIESVLVKPGQQVAVGQELARVQSLELESLQSELLKTTTEITALEQLIKQREPLVASGGIAGKVLLESMSNLQRKRAQRDIVSYKLQALGVDAVEVARLLQTGVLLHSIPVLAPVAGTIESIDTRPGQLVESTDHLFDIVALSTLSVVGEVLEADLFQVLPGLPAEVTFAGRSNVKLTGQIEHIRMKMDAARRSWGVVVSVDNRAGLLRPGMSGRMAIEVAAVDKAILCPTASLIETERGSFVLKRESKGKYSRRPVQIGLRSRDMVVIEAGLFPGQQVVSRGAHLLASLFDGVSFPKTVADGRTTRLRTQPVVTQTSATQAWVLAAKAEVELPTSRKAFATSLIEGRVASIAVRPGESVEVGDVLAEVESQQVRNVQLDLLQESETMRWLRGEVERLRPLAEAGKTSTREFISRTLELKTHLQTVAGLERRLSLIGLESSLIGRLRTGEWSDDSGARPVSGRIAIRSSISGHVAGMGLKLGQLVHAHDSLFEIQDTSRIWIRALVLANEADRVLVGQQAVATFPSHPNLRVNGKVVRIAPQLVSRERVLPVWMEIPNPQGFLKDGMLARVQINAPKLPAVAVRDDGAK
ncbi:MAG: efflux RND transporter periplasmic adaptor subunit [Planctomycetota bacterium]|nr:efflux RND transporter periplasmic adaptor subunit [Planctomycetota bacterium]